LGTYFSGELFFPTSGDNIMLKKLFQLLLIIGMLMNLDGCASASDSVNYSFEFNLGNDNQHAAILDYWYGNSRRDWWINATPELVKQGQLFYFEGVFQPMPPGGLLYVKWRDTDTGKTYEDTVDLRQRLTRNIENHSLYLMIKGPQLYVYLVSPEHRALNMPSNGPQMYASRKVTTIYPDQSK
jgi:hypothetical protein